jgi:putative DNA primase/helicase
MESNVVAKTPDSSAGFERRFLQITWDQQVPESKRDYDLHRKLVAEREGIMVWAVEGFRRLHARGRFVHTAKSAEATAELLRHLDQIGSYLGDTAWVEDLGSGVASYVGMDEMFDHWRDWCETHAVKPFTDERAFFAKEVRKKRPQWDTDGRFKRRFDELGAKKSVIIGLRLRPQE